MKTEKFIKKWEKYKRKGKKKFVIYQSIIMGTGMFTGSIIGWLLLGDLFDVFKQFDSSLALMIGGIIGGAIGGILQWDSNEEKYNQLINNNK